MSQKIIKQLEEVFGNMNEFSPEKLQGLVQETMRTLELIQNKVKSEDPKEKEEGLKIALEFKQALESQAEVLCKSVGMDPVQLSEFVQNPDNFSKEEWDTLGIAKKELNLLKQGLHTQEQANAVLKVSKKKNPKTWLVG